jgi:hypothetical protein
VKLGKERRQRREVVYNLMNTTDNYGPDEEVMFMIKQG